MILKTRGRLMPGVYFLGIRVFNTSSFPTTPARMPFESMTGMVWIFLSTMRLATTSMSVSGVTVMGLIVTLANAGGDPNELIHHIATAFIATLWGIFMANLVWLPIADKLKTINGEENLVMEVTLEGILSLQAGEIPAIVRAKLRAMLPSSEQGEI